MKYVGGKHRLGPKIVPIMLEGIDISVPYVEPFVGSGAVIQHVKGRRRIAADANPYIIALLKAVQQGWKPPTEVSNTFWRSVRDHKDAYPPELVGFIGFNCSYAARFFEGYARDPKTGHNYAASGSRSLLKQAPLLTGIKFTCCKYQDLELPAAPAVIYCDPPYFGSVHDYYRTGKFDHEAFWQWCRDRARNGYLIYVSEFTAPKDVECVWQLERACSLTKNTGAMRRVDCLFRVRGK